MHFFFFSIFLWPTASIHVTSLVFCNVLHKTWCCIIERTKTMECGESDSFCIPHTCRLKRNCTRWGFCPLFYLKSRKFFKSSTIKCRINRILFVPFLFVLLKINYWLRSLADLFQQRFAALHEHFSALLLRVWWFAAAVFLVFFCCACFFVLFFKLRPNTKRTVSEKTPAPSSCSASAHKRMLVLHPFFFWSSKSIGVQVIYFKLRVLTPTNKHMKLIALGTLSF